MTRPAGEKSKVRVVVAGQIPPPVHGQNVIVAHALEELSRIPNVQVSQLRFDFTRTHEDVGSFSARKVFQTFLVIGRLIRLRLAGPIDVLLYPVGGPSNAFFRDLAVLPFVYMTARRTILHFHAGGHAQRWRRNWGLGRLGRLIYRHATDAIVMTPFNAEDPKFLGIDRIHVVPHRIRDTLEETLINRSNPPTRFLSVGSISRAKGIPDLVAAFARVAKKYPEIELELVGPTQSTYPVDRLLTEIAKVGMVGRIVWTGPLDGDAKWRRLGEADMFVFSSVAEGETFGLVLAEAMMWKLPIIATNWRGNSEVLGEDFGGICFDLDPNLTDALEQAILQALSLRDQWEAWGVRNRKLFEEAYSLDTGAWQLPDVVVGDQSKRASS